MKLEKHAPLLQTLDVLWHDLASYFVLGRYNDHNLINALFAEIWEDEDPLGTLKIVYEREATRPQVEFETVLGLAYMAVRGFPEESDLYRVRLAEAGEKLLKFRGVEHD